MNLRLNSQLNINVTENMFFLILLIGDSAHKSHMQSIMDKLQSPGSFGQSVQELVIALQRSGDPGCLASLRPHLEHLAAIDPNPGQ